MKGLRHKSGGASPLSPYEVAIWQTVAINLAADEGGLGRRPPVPTSFPPRLLRDEQMLARGPFRLLDHKAIGSGEYVHKDGIFMATGPGGLVLSGAFAAGQALANSSRRRQATASATPRWHVIEQGMLFVSTGGFYFDTGHSLLAWAYTAVTAAELTGPGALRITGESENGPIAWLLESDWAELVFTLWARAVHPQHPQYLAHRWLPPGWVERAEASPAGLPQRRSPEIGGNL